MTTEAQLAANRANAQLSTGPKTEEGKAKSSRNSIKHGIFCKDLLLPGEDADALRNLRNGMLLSFNPKNEAELAMVDRIIDACWRLQRVRSAENQRLTQAFPQYGLSTAQQLFAQMFERVEKTPERYQAYTTRLENQMHRAINQLRAMRKEQQQQNEASEFAKSRVQDQPVQDEPAEAQATVLSAPLAVAPLKYEPAPGKNLLSHENLIATAKQQEQDRQIQAILAAIKPRR